MSYKSIVLAAFALSTSAIGLAQENKEAPKSRRDDNIIISKKGSSKEKLNVVIDGDKVTINGKPVEEYKGSDITIMRTSDIMDRIKNLDIVIPPMPPIPPIPPIEVYPQIAGMFRFHNSNKAFLGVGTEKAGKGAKINSISKESPAEKAGLQKGDIITKINETKIEGADDLHDAIGKFNTGDKIDITYLRDGKEMKASATLDKNTSEDADEFKFDNNFNFNFDMPDVSEFKNFGQNFIRKPKLGLQIQDVETGKGAKVLDVDSDTPAAKAGLQKDDIIIEANGKEITGVDDLRSNLKNTQEGDVLKLKYTRDGKIQTTEIKFPKKLKTVDL